MKISVAASLLSADMCRLGSEVERAAACGADIIHFDVMDGVFVNNLSFGFPVLKAVRKASSLPLDIHLMITDPIRYTDRFAEYGADNITVHAEACSDIKAVLDNIHSHGITAGLALKPATPLSEAEFFIKNRLIDMLLIMTVEPGFGGQGFINGMTDKISAAKQLIDRFSPGIHIQVDGGINSSTAKNVAAAGADVLVAGSYLFRADDMKSAVSGLKTHSR